MKLPIFQMHRSEARSGGSAEPGGGPAGAAALASAAAAVEIARLRERILNRLYQVGAVLGLLAMMVNLPVLGQTLATSPTQGWQSAGTIALVYVALLIAGFLPSVRYRLSYSTRALLLLLALFIVGIQALISTSLYGSGPILLLTVAYLTVILLGGNTGPGGGWSDSLRSAPGLGLGLAIGGLAVVEISRFIGWMPAPYFSFGLAAIISALVNFTLLACAGVISLGLLLDGLHASLEKQSRQSASLAAERQRLEDNVRQSTASLERRLAQLRTAAEISRTFASELDLQVLLPQVCELVQQRFTLYYVGIFLVETPAAAPNTDAATRSARAREAVGASVARLTAGTGSAGRAMLAEGHQLPVGGDSMIGWAIANQQPRIALDVGQEAVRFNNPHLPRTRSELALPIISAARQSRPGQAAFTERQVLGALTIQSAEEAAFDQDDILVLQGIADALAGAIENGRLFAEMRASYEEIQRLHRQYLEKAWTNAIETHGALEAAWAEAAPAAAAAAPGLHRMEVPFQLRGQRIGSIALDRQTPWTPEQRQLVEAVVNQATLALENARLLEETRRQAENERLGAQLSSRMWTAQDIDGILQTALQELAQTLNASVAEIELEL